MSLLGDEPDKPPAMEKDVVSSILSDAPMETAAEANAISSSIFGDGPKKRWDAEADASFSILAIPKIPASPEINEKEEIPSLLETAESERPNDNVLSEENHTVAVGNESKGPASHECGNGENSPFPLVAAESSRSNSHIPSETYHTVAVEGSTTNSNQPPDGASKKIVGLVGIERTAPALPGDEHAFFWLVRVEGVAAPIRMASKSPPKIHQFVTINTGRAAAGSSFPPPPSHGSNGHLTDNPGGEDIIERVVMQRSEANGCSNEPSKDNSGGIQYDPRHNPIYQALSQGKHSDFFVYNEFLRLHGYPPTLNGLSRAKEKMKTEAIRSEQYALYDALSQSHVYSSLTSNESFTPHANFGTSGQTSSANIFTEQTTGLQPAWSDGTASFGSRGQAVHAYYDLTRFENLALPSQPDDLPFRSRDIPGNRQPPIPTLDPAVKFSAEDVARCQKKNDDLLKTQKDHLAHTTVIKNATTATGWSTAPPPRPRVFVELNLDDAVYEQTRERWTKDPQTLLETLLSESVKIVEQRANQLDDGGPEKLYVETVLRPLRHCSVLRGPFIDHTVPVRVKKSSNASGHDQAQEFPAQREKIMGLVVNPSP